MAEGDEEDQAEESKGSNKLIIIIAGAVLLLLVLGGAFFMMSSGGGKGKKEVINKPQKPPEYIEIKGLTTNLLSRDNELHYIQVDLFIAVNNQEYMQKLEKFVPYIRSELLRYYSELYWEDTTEGGFYEIIRNESKELVQSIAKKKMSIQEVEDVLLKNVVVQ